MKAAIKVCCCIMRPSCDPYPKQNRLNPYNKSFRLHFAIDSEIYSSIRKLHVKAELLDGFAIVYHECHIILIGNGRVLESHWIMLTSTSYGNECEMSAPVNSSKQSKRFFHIAIFENNLASITTKRRERAQNPAWISITDVGRTSIDFSCTENHCTKSRTLFFKSTEWNVLIYHTHMNTIKKNWMRATKCR